MKMLETVIQLTEQITIWNTKPPQHVLAIIPRGTVGVLEEYDTPIIRITDSNGLERTFADVDSLHFVKLPNCEACNGAGEITSGCPDDPDIDICEPCKGLGAVPLTLAELTWRG